MKSFLLALLLVLIPHMAFAMTTPLLTENTITNPTNAGGRFFGLTGHGGRGGAGSLNTETPMPTAGTINNLRFAVPTSVTTGNYQMWLLKNGTRTALTCTISSGTSCSDTVHPISVVAGTDTMSIEVEPSGTPTAETQYYSSETFDGTVDGESIVMGGVSGTFSNTYGSFGYEEANPSASEINNSVVFPTAGTLDKFYVLGSSGPGAGTSWAFTVRQNNATTSITCSIANTNVACNDTADSITVAAGDTIDFRLISTGAASTGRNINLALRFKPTVNGESVMLAKTNAAVSAGLSATMYTGGDGSDNTDAVVETVAPVAFTWKKLYVNFDNSPGVGTSRAIASRINSVTGALTCTVSNTSTVCNDPTNSDSVSAGNLFNWQTTPSNVPAASTNMRFSAVMFIAPAAAAVTSHVSGFFGPFMSGFFGPGVSGYFL